jgi:hypothetical protein
LLFELGGELQPPEPVGPESIEELTQVGEALGARAVEAARSIAALAEQTGGAQHRDVLGDRGACHLEAGGNLTGAQLSVAHEGEDLAAAGLGNRAGDFVHPRYESIDLRK